MSDQDQVQDRYDPQAIEEKWQRFWEEQQTFRAVDFSEKPKYYVLDMFPYPSGAGLHVGHPEGYTATDIVCRYKRMRGFNVLHPMGWDAFGLPAEKYAVDTGTHPRITTQRNIATFKRQIQRLGFSYDWSREIDTTDPRYYKWTQWIFLQLFHKGLAYTSEAPVNWCPHCRTVVANEEVTGGVHERCGKPMERRSMKQWMLRITAYAERLLADLEGLDWSESVKTMQREWIGRSEGADVDFRVASPESAAGETIRVFTTRPDTLYGATYMVLSPEHPLVPRLTTDAQRAAVEAYVQAAARKSDLERTDLAKEKTGVFTGGYAVNPVTGAPIPVWVADYVLSSYGTGAIMAVPAHDTRDYEFAVQYAIPIVRVVSETPDGPADAPVTECFAGEGWAVNSGPWDGLPTAEFKQRITAWLEERGLGKLSVNYRLRDWLFSRQRYWGEPFPVIVLDDGTVKTLPESALPLTLPAVERYEPSGTGESPLATVHDWVHTTDPETGRPARRETHTMPQWAGSCWYYLRFIDPQNDEKAWDPAKERYWMPVDLYVGGAEHAVLHLLYARFWHKVLFDLGFVSTVEPFQKLVNQGMILGFAYRCFKDAAGGVWGTDDVVVEGGVPRHEGTGEVLTSEYVPVDAVKWEAETAWHPTAPGVRLDVLTEKMSKSRGNVVNPDVIVAEYGADAMRLYEMFMGPLEVVKPWNTKDIQGVRRFLDRVWRLVARGVSEEPAGEAQRRALHKTIDKVTRDLDAMRFNTAISALMVLVNELYREERSARESLEGLVLLVSPFAPHLGEELWRRLGHTDTLACEPWPQADPALLVEDTVVLAVQVNGKLRAQLEVARDLPAAEIERQALALPNVQTHTAGLTVRKVIVVPGRIVNIVVSR